jgi:CBS-domain-containing membrane protein
MCTVSDIMTRKVLTVAAEADLDDAAWGLTLRGISGAPVKDDQGNLVGILSKSDLIDPARADGIGSHHTAADAMTPILFTALATDSVKFAVQRMVETGAHRLVVVDTSGALVGIVTPMDVLRMLLDGKLDPNDFAPQGPSRPAPV